MRHLFLPLFFAMTTVLLLSSCLNSDDEDNTTYYYDTAISSVTLGTLRVMHHTTAYDGVTDSTYYTSLTGSTYKFDIDQLNATAYNNDSLPVGTDAAHVLVTISTINSGTPILVLQSSEGNDSLAYYSSTDSIDFTNPVRVRIYNMLATAYREYTITLNVHKETADSFQWKSSAVEGLAEMTGRKFVASNGNTYITGTVDGVARTYQNTSNGWVETTPLSSAATEILGSTDYYQYKLDGNSIMRSADGNTWVKDSLDDRAAYLPESDANLIVRASEINDGTNNLILIGNRNGRTVVWSKVEEPDNAGNPWAYYPYDTYNKKTLPYLSNLRAIAYDDGILATGGDFSTVYYSPDNGLTWDAESTYSLPEDFGLEETPFAFGVDSNNIMYISKDGSNIIWSGRLARLGWKKADTVFTK